VVWFALNDDRPLFAFAGIWTDFKGDRGTKVETGSRSTSRLRIPDDVAERRRRADLSEGDAGDLDDR
jgi:hypothetical protein